jgi:hypothetical protein
MTSAIKGPNKGSGAYQALQHLQKMGGQATPAALMSQLLWEQTPGRFQRLIVGPLERQRLVLRRDEALTLTSRGQAYLDPASSPAPAAASSAYPVPSRPLSPCNRPSARVLRPGAFDYQGIPSLHAGKQVAFRSSIKVQHEDSNG